LFLENNVDQLWNSVAYPLINNIEILAYTLGASFPILTPYFIRRAAERSSNDSSRGYPKWRRILNPFSRAQHSASVSRDTLVMNEMDPNKGGLIIQEKDSGVHISSNSSQSSGDKNRSKRRGERIQGWTEVMASTANENV